MNVAYDDLYDEDAKCKLSVSVIIVTRGNVDLTAVKRIGEWVCVTEVIVWDNSQRENLSVYGRYAAIAEAKEQVVLVQDDDCYLWPACVQGLVAAYEPGVLVANMPEPFRAHYSDSCLVGFGAIFDRDLPHVAFNRLAQYMAANEQQDEWLDPQWKAWFERCSDVVFSTLTPFRLVDLPYENMPWATGPDRMYRSKDHVGERARMLDLARQVRDAR